MNNTQTRFEERVVALARETPRTEVTFDREYVNTGVLRIWDGKSLSLRYEVGFSWAGQGLSLQPVRFSKRTLDARHRFGSDKLNEALLFVGMLMREGMTG